MIFSPSTVGTSQRTPGKHAFGDAILGSLVGSSPHIWWLKSPFIMLDLCAGDGMDSIESGLCSPGIFWKHSEWLLKHHPAWKCHTLLVEKDFHTHQALVSNVMDYEPTSDRIVYPEIYNGENTDDYVFEFVNKLIQPNSPVFIHNDPNQASSLKMNTDLINLFSSRGKNQGMVTTLSTLGCNVGGLKRLPKVDRQEWIYEVEQLVSILRPHQDAELFALDEDKSQWAYLITAPKIWINDGRFKKAFRKAFDFWPKSISSAVYSSEESNFWELMNRLALTKKEFEGWKLT